MKRRILLSFSAGLVLGAAVLAAGAQAAPRPPISAAVAVTVPAANTEPAVVSQDEVDQIKPVQVRWHRHHWRHRHWRRGWHHRHWRHHRHW